MTEYWIQLWPDGSWTLFRGEAAMGPVGGPHWEDYLQWGDAGNVADIVQPAD